MNMNRIEEIDSQIKALTEEKNKIIEENKKKLESEKKKRKQEIEEAYKNYRNLVDKYNYIYNSDYYNSDFNKLLNEIFSI